MKIVLIAVEDGLICMGHRHVSSAVKEHFDDVTSYIYNVSGNLKSFLTNHLFFKVQALDNIPVNPDFVCQIADADVVGFSCMSKYSLFVTQRIADIKKINPNCYIVWGGVHAITDPDHAIQHADAVCTGEGEFAMVNLLNNFNSPEREKTHQFWFRYEGKVIKNPFLPLMSPEEMEALPLPDLSEDIIYADAGSMHPLDASTYLRIQGTSYTTVWTIGCPFKCTYCGNSKFLANDSKYAKIRHTSPERFIKELQHAMEMMPFITYIIFGDDNFFFAKPQAIFELADLYAKEIGQPFFMPGIFPGSIRDERQLDAMIDAGLRHARMGIQSGSEKLLEFYKRPTKLETVEKAANMLISRYPRIAPPYIDIIIDNPIEDEEDIQATVALLRRLPRPYTLFVYSLRIIANTEMAFFAKENPEMEFLGIEDSYQRVLDIRYALLVYTASLVRLPDPLHRVLEVLARVPLLNKGLLLFVRLLCMSRRFFSEVGNHNLLPLNIFHPQTGYLMHRLGYMRLLRRRSLEKSRQAASSAPFIQRVKEAGIDLVAAK